MNKTKVCRKCLKRKYIQEFTKQYNKKTKVHSIRTECNKCRGIYIMSRYLTNKKFRDKAKLSRKRHHFKQKYGLSLDDLESLHRKQNYKCAICNKRKKLAVDHCHKTNRIRGLLCFSCNTGIGKFQDNIALFKKAINYILIS